MALKLNQKIHGNMLISTTFYLLIGFLWIGLLQHLIKIDWVVLVILVPSILFGYFILEIPQRIANQYQLTFEFITQAEYDELTSELALNRENAKRSRTGSEDAP